MPNDDNWPPPTQLQAVFSIPDSVYSDPPQLLYNSEPPPSPTALHPCVNCGEDKPFTQVQWSGGTSFTDKGPVRLYLCFACANKNGGSGYFCPHPDCGYWVHPPANYIPIGTPVGSLIPCPDHSSSDNPRWPCDNCGVSNLPWVEMTTTRRNKIYCLKCSGSLFKCAALYCNCFVHPSDKATTRTEKTKGKARNIHFCYNHIIKELPQWFPTSFPEQWDYRNKCTCIACTFLTTSDPQNHPREAIKGKLHPCNRCTFLNTKASMTKFDNNYYYCHYCMGISGTTVCKLCKADTPKSHMFSRVSRGDTKGGWCFSCTEARGRHVFCKSCGLWWPKANKCDCNGLHAYNYTPPILAFHTTNHHHKTPFPNPNTLHLGLELEVELPILEGGFHTDEQMEKRLNAISYINQNTPWAYVVKDGSLSGVRADGSGGDYGFELVTHPFTFDWFNDNWEEIQTLLTTLSSFGLRAWKQPRCGIHVHVSRAPMSEMHQMKFIRFIYGSVNLALSVGQRGYRSSGIKKFSPFTEDRSLLIRKIRNFENPGANSHHAPINAIRKSTLEGRWFRGTLNPNSLRKNIEFMTAVWHFTKKYGLASSNEVNFIDWLRGTPESSTYPVLLDYLERNYMTRPWKLKGRR